jgi:Putative lipoprotein LpqV
MPRYLLRAVGAAAVVTAIASGCSSTPEPAPTSTAAPAPTSSERTSPAPVAPGDVGVSEGGVTTAVGAPADSTEDDYFQACRAARTWMDQHGGDPANQIEPYLKQLQSADSVGPGAFDKRWVDLTPEQQSAVIVAVQAAADALCG